MNCFNTAIFVLFLTLAQPCVAGPETSSLLNSSIPIRGSAGAKWVYRFCSFTFPNGPETKIKSNEAVLVDLDAPLPVKQAPVSPPETPDLSGFSPYLDYLQEELKRNWQPRASKKLEQSSFTVTFDVSRNGEISQIRSTAFASTSASLVKALKKITPLRPLPEGCPDIELTLMFDYQSS